MNLYRLLVTDIYSIIRHKHPHKLLDRLLIKQLLHRLETAQALPFLFPSEGSDKAFLVLTRGSRKAYYTDRLESGNGNFQDFFGLLGLDSSRLFMA